MNATLHTGTDFHGPPPPAGNHHLRVYPAAGPQGLSPRKQSAVRTSEKVLNHTQPPFFWRPILGLGLQRLCAQINMFMRFFTYGWEMGPNEGW